MWMCRESRKIFDMLDKLAQDNDIQGFITPGHIYICDRLVLQFYTQPIMNLLKSKISNQKHCSWKHFTVEYWESMIYNTFSDNNSIKRECGSVGLGNQEGFNIVNSVLIADYSLSDAYLYNHIINEYDTVMVDKACKVARSMNVPEIRYISAVIDKEHARQQVRMEKIESMDEKITKSTNEILNKPLVQHTPLELAEMEYQWQRMRDNAELERMYAEKFGDK